MTREEQIAIASCAYGSRGSSIDFTVGAKWADSHPKSPWISVEDDLPCNHEELIIDEPLYKRTKPIVCNKPHGISVDQMVYNISRNEWYWTGETPIHWFPIPEPPKE